MSILLLFTLTIVLVVFTPNVQAFGAGSKHTALRSPFLVDDIRLTLHFRYRLDISRRRSQLASWRYRGRSQDGGLYLGSQMDLHNDQAGLLWVLSPAEISFSLSDG